jgi:hypothetical protein
VKEGGEEVRAADGGGGAGGAGVDLDIEFGVEVGSDCLVVKGVLNMGVDKQEVLYESMR